MINNINLFNLQSKIVNKAISSLLINNSFGFFDEVRTGKTLMVLETLYQLINHDKNIYQILIIANSNILYKWKNEIKEWWNFEAIIINEQKKYFDLKNYDKTTFQIYLLGIELFSIHKDKFCLLFNNLLIKVIVLDESHSIKNPRTKRFKAISKLIKIYCIKYRICLTGTPAPNNSADIYSQFHFLMPKLFKSYWNFVNKYCIFNEFNVNGRKIRKVIGINDEKKPFINKLLHNISSNSKRIQHNFYYSNIKEKVITIESTNDQWKWYKELQNNEIITFPNKVQVSLFNEAPSLVLLGTILQLGFAPENYGIKGNINQWIKKQLKNKSKIVIVSRYTSYLLKLAEIFKEYKNLTYTGKDTIKVKHQKLEIFKNENHQILFANYLALKEGLNLYHIDRIIFLDLPWSPAVFEQCKNRITPPISADKSLMDRKKIIYLLKNDLPISKWLFDLVKAKKSVIKEINNYSSFSKILKYNK